MEGSRPGVGNLEAVIVVLVLIDIVVREIGNPNICRLKDTDEVLTVFPVPNIAFDNGATLEIDQDLDPFEGFGFV
jgi:hypothetical protein